MNALNVKLLVLANRDLSLLLLLLMFAHGKIDGVLKRKWTERGRQRDRSMRDVCHLRHRRTLLLVTCSHRGRGRVVKPFVAAYP
jgi:hypothetical protein